MKNYFLYVCVGLILLPPPHAAAAQKSAPKARPRVVVHKHVHTQYRTTTGDYIGAAVSVLGVASGLWYLLRSRTARVDKIEKDTQQILQKQVGLEQGQARLEKGQQRMSEQLNEVDAHVGRVDAGVQVANGQLAEHTQKLQSIEAEAKSIMALLEKIRATQSEHSTALTGLEQQLKTVASAAELQKVKQMLEEQCAAFKAFTEQGHLNKADLEQFAVSLEGRVQDQIKTTVRECLLQNSSPNLALACSAQALKASH